MAIATDLSETTIRAGPASKESALPIWGRSSLLAGVFLIGCMVVAAATLLVGSGESPVRDRLAIILACSMLMALPVGVLLLGWQSMRRLLAHLEDQLRRLSNDEQIEAPRTSAPMELRGVMSALGDFVRHFRGKLDHLRLQKAELDLQIRLAEAERRNTEAILLSIPEAVLVVNPAGELSLANAGAERLFAFRLSQWRYRPIEQVVQDPSLARLLREQLVSAEQRANRQLEYSATREGRTETFTITFSPIFNADGGSRGIVAVFHDVTQERQLAQAQNDFVSRVSHELRTPLSSIKAYMELLTGGEVHDDDTRDEFHHIITSETERLQRLIANILNISRIESGIEEINPELVQVHHVIKQVLDAMAPQAAGKALCVEFMPVDALPPIWADRDMLHQAIMNVVSNAIKYTPPGGRVAVLTHRDDTEHITIEVSDTGVGIRTEDLPRIFDKFYRARDSHRIARGTGLGLNLVKRIVETAHHGEILVTSEHQVGTTVRLRFPIEAAEPLRQV